MKKSVLIISIVIILILLLGGIYFYIRYVVLKEGNEANQIGYDYLNCLIECPTYTTESNFTDFEYECLRECSNKYNLLELSNDLLKKYEKNHRKLLLNSEESFNCMSLGSTNRNMEKAKVCLREVLPELKERYNV